MRSSLAGRLSLRGIALGTGEVTTVAGTGKQWRGTVDFDAAERHTLAEQLHYESERQRELIDGPAFREGVSAFLQKRPPAFDGR